MNPSTHTSGRRRPRGLKAFVRNSRKRQLKPYEMFSKLYYQTEIRPAVEKALMSEKGLSKGDKLNLVKKISQEVYDQQDQAVKDEIEVKLTESAQLEEDDSDGDDDVRSPEQYQQ